MQTSTSPLYSDAQKTEQIGFIKHNDETWRGWVLDEPHREYPVVDKIPVPINKEDLSEGYYLSPFN